MVSVLSNAVAVTEDDEMLGSLQLLGLTLSCVDLCWWCLDFGI